MWFIECSLSNINLFSFLVRYYCRIISDLELYKRLRQSINIVNRQGTTAPETLIFIHFAWEDCLYIQVRHCSCRRMLRIIAEFQQGPLGNMGHGATRVYQS